MVPIDKVKDIITKHDALEKELSSGNVDPKLFAKKSLYELIKNTKSDYEKKDFFKVIINFPREELIHRIRVRVENMIKNGAISEVKKFVKLKVPKSKTASKAIGIIEITDYLKKKIQKQYVIEKISIKTRQYAKRQVTWSRGNMLDWKFVNTKDIKNFLNKIN